MLNFFGSSCFSASISKKNGLHQFFTSTDRFVILSLRLSFRVLLHSRTARPRRPAYCLFPAYSRRTAGISWQTVSARHEIAFRIVFASIIFPSFFRLAQDHFFSALRTRNTDLFQIRLRVLAVRESRAGEEFSVRAVFDHHVAAAVLADDICHLILYLNFFEVLFCLCDRLIEIRPEVLDYCLPRNTAISNLSSRASIVAVKLTSTMLGNASFIMLLTTSPSSVM